MLSTYLTEELTQKTIAGLTKIRGSKEQLRKKPMVQDILNQLYEEIDGENTSSCETPDRERARQCTGL